MGRKKRCLGWEVRAGGKMGWQVRLTVTPAHVQLCPVVPALPGAEGSGPWDVGPAEDRRVSGQGWVGCGETGAPGRWECRELNLVAERPALRV